jgi:hypothetical protein
MAKSTEESRAVVLVRVLEGLEAENTALAKLRSEISEDFSTRMQEVNNTQVEISTQQRSIRRELEDRLKLNRDNGPEREMPGVNIAGSRY